MGSTYFSLHVHAVFSTKERRPWIEPGWRLRLHDYLGGTVRGLGGFSEVVGGVEDHVHALFGLRATHCLADFMRELKKGSSKWVHEHIGVAAFEWQQGYAAFTVSPGAREDVRRYIARQEEHHQRRSFHVELVEMLGRAGVTFDPRYMD